MNLIGIYSTSIFEGLKEDASESAGEETISPIVGTAMVGVAQLVGCFIAPCLVGVVGMRSIFIGGQALMGLCLMTVGFSSQT